MAATGYTPISLYYSTTASTAPTAGNLVNGELAINITDGKLYYKDNTGTVKVIAGTGGAGIAGGSNTQVQYNSSGNLAGSSSFVFDGTNVGIGTSSPATKLQVVGTTLLGSASTYGASTAAISVYNGSSSANYYKADNHYWQLAAGTDTMTINASGNVGIGTSSPNYKLSIYDASTPRIQLINSTSGTATTDGYVIYTSGTAAYFLNREADATYFGNNNTVQATLDSSGNLGLGVTPSASTAKQFEIGYAGQGLSSRSGVMNYVLNGTYNSGWKYAGTGAVSNFELYNGTFAWYTAPSGTAGNAISFTQTMALDASGKLGLGTSSPSEKLQIVGTGDLKAELQTDSTNGAAFRWKNASYSYLWQLYSGAFRVYDETAGAERMRIDSSGNVGIGYTSPSTYGKLAVNGNLYSSSRSTNSTQSAANPGWWLVGTFGNFGGSDAMEINIVGAAGYASGSDNIYAKSKIILRCDNASNLKGYYYNEQYSSATSIQGCVVTNAGAVYVLVGSYFQMTVDVLMSAGNTWTPSIVYNSASGSPPAGNTLPAWFGIGIGGSPAFCVNSSSNVGIGNTSPTTKLDVSGSSSLAALRTPNILEISTVSATAATGTINFDVTTQSVVYYTSNASGNFTLNFRGSSGTSLNTIMNTGDTVTVTFLCTNGGTAYYNSAVQVDGSSVTPKWLGGTAPTSGNASAVDAYTYAIIKTGNAAFTVLASQTKFA